MATLFKRSSGGKKTGCWIARYRTADGRIVEKSTATKNRESANIKLSEWLRLEEQIRLGLVTQDDLNQARHGNAFIEDLIEDQARHMRSLGRAGTTIRDQKRLMKAVAGGCGWQKLAELNRPDLERFLDGMIEAGRSARTRNAHLVAAVCFCSWCVKKKLLPLNPLKGIERINEAANRKHERRIYTPADFARLVNAAEKRPLMARLKQAPDTKEKAIDRLSWIGKARAAAYRVLYYTGLRYGELRRIRLSQVHLESDTPHIELAAADEKNRSGSLIPLHADLLPHLEAYIQERKKRLVAHPTKRGKIVAFPGSIGEAPLFDLPEGTMVASLEKDLYAAGLVKKDGDGKINRRDEQGRVWDVHGLRHSFCTLIAQSGVNQQTAQKLMRHKTPSMTARYTHLNLRDLGGAMAVLPSLPAIESPENEAVAQGEENTPHYPPLNPPLLSGISCPNLSVKDGIEQNNATDTVRQAHISNANKDGGFVRDSREKRVVGEAGIEPAFSCEKRILSPSDKNRNPNDTNTLQNQGGDTPHENPNTPPTFEAPDTAPNHGESGPDTAALMAAIAAMTPEARKAILEALSEGKE